MTQPKTIQLNTLLNEMVECAANHFRTPSHPPRENGFDSMVKQDIVAAIDGFKGTRTKFITSHQAEFLLETAQGIGQRTSVNIRDLSQKVIQEIHDPSTPLGQILCDTQLGQSAISISKDFLLEKLKTNGGDICDWELSAFEKALPDTISEKQQVVDALNNALGSDYEGDIEDAITIFKKEIASATPNTASATSLTSKPSALEC